MRISHPGTGAEHRRQLLADSHPIRAQARNTDDNYLTTVIRRAIRIHDQELKIDDDSTTTTRRQRRGDLMTSNQLSGSSIAGRPDGKCN